MLVANVCWLTGYRHRRHRLAELDLQLREVFTSGLPLHGGAELVGNPVAVLFHLLWQHELHAGLSRPLHPDTLVTTVDAGVPA